MAGEMILSQMLNEEKSILSPNWYYSTELRVVNLQWFFRLGLLLSPNNWHVARVIGTSLLILVTIISYLFFGHQAGFKNNGAWTAMALVWPLSQWYLFISLSSGYYLIYITFSCLILGLIFQYDHGKYTNWKKWLLTGLIFILSFLSGLNGIKQLLVFFVPLVIATFIIVCRELLLKATTIKEFLSENSKVRIFILSLLSSIFSFAGYLINSKILINRYHFDSFAELTWHETLSFEKMLAVWADYFSLYGYHSNTKVFGYNGIASVLGLFLAFLVIYCTYILLKQRERLSVYQAVILFTFVFGLLFCGIVFALTTMYSICYWLPLLPFSLLVLQTCWETCEIKMPVLQKTIAVLFNILVMIISIGAIRYELTYPIRGQYEMHSVVDLLEAKNYTEGYASFWNSNVITEMSSGKIDVWTVQNFEDGSLKNKLAKTEHDEQKPQAPYFLLLNKEQDSIPDALLSSWISMADEILLDDENYLLLGFSTPIY